jgi:hypothetical protein
MSEYWPVFGERHVPSGVFSVPLTTWVVCTMGMSERCDYVCTN